MTLAAASALAASAPVAPPPTPFPSPAALELERMSWGELDRVFLRGVTPAIDALVGWEFRGINTQLFHVRDSARWFGIKKFVKGFFRREVDGAVMGYNSPVHQNVLDGRWHIAPKRFGFYLVEPVDPTTRDNTYLHAILLDYGRGGNRRFDLTSGLRDYLVQVDPQNPDLFLGKAYYATGPLRVASNFFLLERHRVGLTDYARR